MKTVRKNAWNTDTDQEYEIELPADSIIREFLLEIDYPKFLRMQEEKSK